jgi:nitrogen fixation protein NifX
MALKTHMKVLDSNTEESWIDAAFRVAFASTDMHTVNQHFGSASSLAVYAVDMERTKLLEVFQFGEAEPHGEHAEEPKASVMPNAPTGALDFEDKLAAKIDALDGCIAVYTQAVGASAVGQLKAQGIHPVKVSAGAHISDLLESLQDELRMGPNAWLAKAIKSQSPVDPKRFDQMEAEGWEE